MIVCPRCEKENQAHYKFCLGCGAELPRDAGQAAKKASATPPHGASATAGRGAVGAARPGGKPPSAARKPAVAARPAGRPPSGRDAAAQRPAGRAPSGRGSEPAPARRSEPAPARRSEPAPSLSERSAAQQASGGDAAPQQGADTIACPTCGNAVPANFKFCGACGHNMTAPAAAPASQPAPGPAVESGSLVLIRSDGSEGDAVPLGRAPTVVGRNYGGLFGSDSFLSPDHAELVFQGSSLVCRDLGSLNGVYIRLEPDAPTELVDGTVFRIGQEILRFELLRPQESGDVEVMGSPDPGFLGRIRLVVGRDAFGNSYCVPTDGMHLGRERGDVVFPDDGYVSGLHCRIHGEGGRVFLTDVGSSNGTFLRFAGEGVIPSGSLVLMGQQLFRADY